MDVPTGIIKKKSQDCLTPPSVHQLKSPKELCVFVSVFRTSRKTLTSVLLSVYFFCIASMWPTILGYSFTLTFSLSFLPPTSCQKRGYLARTPSNLSQSLTKLSKHGQNYPSNQSNKAAQFDVMYCTGADTTSIAALFLPDFFFLLACVFCMFPCYFRIYVHFYVSNNIEQADGGQKTEEARNTS